jgi:hypothetical protein
MDTAVNMQGNVTCSDDGTWSYTWQWDYAGDQALGDVHEEFVLTNPSGGIIDAKTEQAHGAEQGQTYIGGGWGNNKVPAGDVTWSLRVIQGGGYLGMTGGSFFAATSP